MSGNEAAQYQRYARPKNMIVPMGKTVGLKHILTHYPALGTTEYM
jgi:hypothetical protein